MISTSQGRWQRRAQLISVALGALLVTSACGEGVVEDQEGLPADAKVASAQEAGRMSRYLQDLYPAGAIARTFNGRSGEPIDCVAIHAQPGLRRAGMEGQEVELAPRTFVEPAVEAGADEGRKTQAVAISDDLLGVDDRGRERGCPSGTVPILRLTMKTLGRFRTLEDFRRKHPAGGGAVISARGPGQSQDAARNSAVPEPPRVGASGHHQYAHAARSISNRGASTTLNLWQPYTERTSEFSLAQLWVVRGSGSSLETVEAGWQKYYDLYGDYRSRLFIYFTPDNYGSGGCYNLSCSGFVQTNSSVFIGGGFSTISALGGAQYDVTLTWYKDGANGHWWLRYGNTWVGYYPRSLFDSAGLQDQASSIDFGGEIIDTPGDGRHTATDMGSGEFAYRGWQYAAYQRNLSYYDTGLVQRAATGLTAAYSDYWCYDLKLTQSTSSWGTYFYFGGSGYNTSCQ